MKGSFNSEARNGVGKTEFQGKNRPVKAVRKAARRPQRCVSSCRGEENGEQKKICQTGDLR